MKIKGIVGAVIFCLFLLLMSSPAQAQEVAAASAMLKKEKAPVLKVPKFDMRPLRLSAYLSNKNSLLQDYAMQIVKVSDRYKVDYRLFPAIAGVESGFCQVYIFATNNCVGWGGGYIPFNSIDEQIETILQALRERYIDDGLTSVDLIGRRWAEDPAWSYYKVKNYMQEIDPTAII